MIWPNDADGETLKRIEQAGFDFSKELAIEFSIDFQNWPPSQEAIRLILLNYPNANVEREDDEDGGYLLVSVSHLLTYEFVTQMQSDLTNLLQGFGGSCQSWGIFQ